MNQRSEKEGEYTKFDELHNEILQQIIPSKVTRDTIAKVISNLFSKVKQKIGEFDLKYELEPILVGSTAKDTYLKNPDVDLFIMFPKSVPISELREMGLKIGHAVLPNGEEHYAEHPYVKGDFEGFDCDIVPCYKLDSIEERMTAVDRTPFHTQFIVEHLAKKQHHEVRLLKQFMKGISAYGAEIEVLGFSGYLAELLILKYGTFLDLLRSIPSWRPNLALKLEYDSEGKLIKNDALKSKYDLPKNLQNKFKDEDMVFIDPVDKTRNVASAVSLDKLNLVISAAVGYMNNPNKNYFFPNPILPFTLEQLKNGIDSNPLPILGVEFKTPELIPDILHGQLRKCQKSIQKLLDNKGFGVNFSEYYFNDNTLILFELNSAILPEVETHYGPPEGHKNALDFKNKWNNSKLTVKKPYIKNARWYVDIKREFITPITLLKAKLVELNLGKHITTEVKDNVRLYEGAELLKKGFELPLTKFISRKFPWEF